MDKLEPLKPEIIVSSFTEKEIHNYIDKLNEIQHTFGPHQGILVHIDSYGGEAYGLIMLYEHLISMGNPIATYTTSKAISAGAFLLAMAGHKGMRFASPNATILVHEIQAMTWGDMKEMEQQMGSITVLNEKILTIFAKCIGLKSAAEVRELIKARSVGHDLTLTAQEAKQLNIVDEVAYVRMNAVMRFDLEVAPQKMPAKAKKTKPKTKAKGKKK